MVIERCQKLLRGLEGRRSDGLARQIVTQRVEHSSVIVDQRYV
jgi:hypothetical protein